MRNPLTLESLMSLAADFPPPLRIIVGFPFIPVDGAAKHERENLLLIGRCTWEALTKNLPATPTLGLGDSLHADNFLGVRVEFYGDRDDHAQILRRIAHDFRTQETPS